MQNPIVAHVDPAQEMGIICVDYSFKCSRVVSEKIGDCSRRRDGDHRLSKEPELESGPMLYAVQLLLQRLSQ